LDDVYGRRRSFVGLRDGDGEVAIELGDVNFFDAPSTVENGAPVHVGTELTGVNEAHARSRIALQGDGFGVSGRAGPAERLECGG